MARKSQFIAALTGIIIMAAASACSLPSNDAAYRTHAVTTAAQRKTLAASDDPGVKALVGKGYEAIAILASVRNGKVVSKPSMRFAICGDKTLEECYDINPTNAHPIIEVAVEVNKSDPSKITFRGPVLVHFPYSDYSNRTCVVEEMNSASHSPAVATPRPLEIDAATVNRLEEIGKFFDNKDFSYAGENTYTKELHGKTWKCFLTGK